MADIISSKFLPAGTALMLDSNALAGAVAQFNKGMITNTPANGVRWFPEPEPLTPTQELCDLACTLNGIEPPNRSKSKMLTLDDLNQVYDAMQQQAYQPQQVIMHPDQYAAFKKALAQK